MRYYRCMADEAEATPVVEPPTEEVKVAAAVRGIGLTKAHVYVEDSEDANMADTLHVSLADYFEGEDPAISAVQLVDGAPIGGGALAGSEAKSCNGKIFGIDTKTCVFEKTFPLGRQDSARVTVSYGGIEQSIDITPKTRSGWLNWDGN